MDNLPPLPDVMGVFNVSYDVQPLSGADLMVVETALRHPSIIRYLQHLESDLLKDFHKIPLTDLLENREHVVLKQAFVMGNLNITQTMLNVHKTPASSQPQGNPNGTSNTRRTG